MTTTPQPFSSTYARFVPPIRARCRRILRSEASADDVVQETFARLWKVGPDPSTTDPTVVLAWLYRTSARIAIDALRDRRRCFDDRASHVRLVVFVSCSRS